MTSKSLIVIPARMASTRFPGKPLVKICGKAMLERVWKIALSVPETENIIATDSGEIAEFAESIGAKVVMTSATCATGLDRAAEVAAATGGSEDRIIITLQGDAVLTPPWAVSAVLEELIGDQKIQIATPMVRLTGSKLAEYMQFKKSGSSTGTTVTFDTGGFALYFSKGIIPFIRDAESEGEVFRHIGLYGYRRKTLLELSKLAQSRFEKHEKLEQLRALENGYKIKMVEVDYRGRTHASVDNPEDISLVESIIEKEGELF